MHDGTHGIDGLNRGGRNPGNLHEEYATELSAAHAEAYVAKGLGTLNFHGTWNGGWTDANENDMIEHTVLIDESCDSIGLSLRIPHDLDDNAGVISLRNTVKEQWKPCAAKTRFLGVSQVLFFN